MIDEFQVLFRFILAAIFTRFTAAAAAAVAVVVFIFVAVALPFSFCLSEPTE